MTAVTDLGDRIARLTIAEAVSVRSYLRDHYGIEASVSLGKVVTPEVIVDPIMQDERDFDVVIEGVDPGNKITVIKAVRELTGAGLAEAKTLVETVPMVVRKGLDKATAEQLKATLEKAGAKVTLRAA